MEKNKKVIGKFKDELGGKIMSEFCALRAKAYAFKLDDDNEIKKAKGTKKCIVKREITFKNYADALFNDEVLIKSQQPFISDHHKVCTEEVNKIALSSNDYKKIQTFDKITTYPYGTNTFMVCENEMKYKLQKKKKKKYKLQRRKMINNDLQIVRSELQVIRDKSLILKNEAQTLRTDSLLLRNELKELIAISQVLKTESSILRAESFLLRVKPHNVNKKTVDVSTQTSSIDKASQYRD